jgi:hypothetical protein
MAALVTLPCMADASPDVLETIHRTDAGTLGPDGWTTAASTEGNFNVRMPCLFSDSTYQASTVDVTRSDLLDCERDGLRYTAARVQYRDAATEERHFENGGTARALPEAVATRMNYRGLPAITLDLKDETECAMKRAVRTDSGSILLRVAGPASSCEAVKQTAILFFDSLELRHP